MPTSSLSADLRAQPAGAGLRRRLPHAGTFPESFRKTPAVGADARQLRRAHRRADAPRGAALPRARTSAASRPAVHADRPLSLRAAVRPRAGRDRRPRARHRRRGRGDRQPARQRADRGQALRRRGAAPAGAAWRSRPTTSPRTGAWWRRPRDQNNGKVAIGGPQSLRGAFSMEFDLDQLARPGRVQGNRGTPEYARLEKSKSRR